MRKVKIKAVVGYTNLPFISLGSTMDENNTVKHKLFPSNSKIIIQSLVGTQPLRLSTLETDRPCVSCYTSINGHFAKTKLVVAQGLSMRFNITAVTSGAARLIV